MKAFFSELYLRWKEPLNTFWRKALIVFGTIGTFALLASEVILPVLVDSEVSHEFKDFLRPFYGWCIGLASAAKLTTANQSRLEFNQKIKESEKDNGNNG